MANEWILDVIADLKAFAQDNGLPSVASGLDDLSVVAAAELASEQECVPFRVRQETGDAGHLLRANGGGRNAG